MRLLRSQHIGAQFLSPSPAQTATQNPATGRWHGQLDITYQWQQRTQIESSYTQAPYRLQRPFYANSPEICESVLLHTAGGIVGGDQLTANVVLKPQTQVLITTAAAQKVYRSDALTAEQTTNITVAANACLEWLPQETIVFAGAQYQQALRVNLAPGGSWLGWDITRFGRTARDEKFETGQWRSQTQIWQQDRPLWIDQQWLPGTPERVQSPHCLAGQPLIGTLAWVGQTVDPALVEQMRDLWVGASGEVGVTRLPLGLLCRYRGSDRLAVRQWFIAIWQLIRQVQGRPVAVPPRVWQL